MSGYCGNCTQIDTHVDWCPERPDQPLWFRMDDAPPQTFASDLTVEVAFPTQPPWDQP